MNFADLYHEQTTDSEVECVMSSLFASVNAVSYAGLRCQTV